MKRWLLCFDMDDTILDDHTQLSKDNQQGLCELRDQGHIVSFVTGRNNPEILDRIGFHDLDYLLLNSGGKLYEVQNKKDVFVELVPPEVSAKIIAYCKQASLPLYILLGRQGVCTAHPNWHSDFYAQSLPEAPFYLENFEDKRDLPIESFLIAKHHQKVAPIIESLDLPLLALGSGNTITDVVLSHVDKWSGIQRMQKELGLESTPVLAVGNYHNDMHMVEGADVGVAVQNASEDLKAVADYVTRRTNNESIVPEIMDLLEKLESGYMSYGQDGSKTVS